MQGIVDINDYLSIRFDNDDAVLTGGANESDSRFLVYAVCLSGARFNYFTQRKRAKPADRFRIPIKRIEDSFRVAADAAQCRLMQMVFMWMGNENRRCLLDPLGIDRLRKHVPLVTKSRSIEPRIRCDQRPPGIEKQTGMADIRDSHV